MPDISMCSGLECPLKETCYRYKATPSDWQSYFSEPPFKEDGTCVYLLGFQNQMVSKKFKKASRKIKKQTVTDSNDLSSPKTSDK